MQKSLIPLKSTIDILQALWRRKFWVLGPTLLGAALAYFIASRIEPTYEASTLILVEGQKVPTDYVKSTVTSRIEERLKTIEQQITKRSSLERLITEAGLYPESIGVLSTEELVAKARKNLRVRVQRNQIFRISFWGADPDSVARAANKLADMFIEENLKLRENQAENTTAFLESELQETKTQLEEQESKLSRFRLKSQGMLPDQRESNFRALEQLQNRLDVNQAAIERLDLRETLLMQNPPPVETAEQLAPKTSRLQQLTLELQELRSQYTDQHPDVVRLEKEITQLRETMNLESTEPSDQPVDQILAQASREVELQQVRREMERLETEQQRIVQEMDTYQARLDQTPRIEQELIGLTRDYSTLRDSYQSLLEKRTEARLAENLERKQQSEQFRKLEEAIPPKLPTAPNLPFLIGGGTAIGLILGVVLALIRDQTDETFDAEVDLREAFPGVPFIIAIPHLRAETQTRQESESPREASTG